MSNAHLVGLTHGAAGLGSTHLRIAFYGNDLLHIRFRMYDQAAAAYRAIVGFM